MSLCVKTVLLHNPCFVKACYFVSSSPCKVLKFAEYSKSTVSQMINPFQYKLNRRYKNVFIVLNNKDNYVAFKGTITKYDKQCHII